MIKPILNTWVIASLISMLYTGFYFVILNLVNPAGNDWTLLEFCTLLGETAISLFCVRLMYGLTARHSGSLRQGYRFALFFLGSAIIFCPTYLIYWIFAVRYWIYALPTDGSVYGGQLLGAVNGLLLPIAIITVMTMHTAEMRSVQMRLLNMEKAVAETKLQNLQQQMDPHFLFNSLNILTALIQVDKARAIQFTQRLSEVYRFFLRTQREFLIPLEEELSLVQSYFYLVECRFGSAFQLRVTDESHSSSERYMIPGTLQLLVENVIKHNQAADASPILITIAIEEERVAVSNRVQRKENLSTGYGLSNLAQRYQLIIKEKVSISEEGGIFCVILPLFKSVVA